MPSELLKSTEIEDLESTEEPEVVVAPNMIEYVLIDPQPL